MLKLKLLSKTRINIDPQKELFSWGGIDMKLFYASVFFKSILLKVVQYYPWPWPPTLCIFVNGEVTWLNEYLSLQKAGLKYFKKYFLDSKEYKKLWQQWEIWVRDYQKISKRLENVKWSSLSHEELHKLLENFYNFNERFWLIVHVPEIANWGGEYLLGKKIKKIDPKNINKYLEILSAPVKFSFFQNEELDLLKLSLIKNKTERHRFLEEHAKKYHWILNSYGGSRVLKFNYFSNKLKKLLEKDKAENLIKDIKKTIKDNIARKKYLYKKLKINKDIILIAEQLSQSIWWQDLRKGYIWRMQYFWDKFLREIARRFGYSFKELQWLYANELFGFFKDEMPSKNILKKRSQYYAFYAEKGNMYNTLNKQEILKLLKIFNGKSEASVNLIKGLMVSPGSVSIIRGRVKIIKNPFTERKKFRKGDILVAKMTSPEFVVLIKKAKGIITDYGGMTCHASIISRELKIPCIVGTKIATQVLKDGDLVEVDANKGAVKVIKRANKNV